MKFYFLIIISLGFFNLNSQSLKPFSHGDRVVFLGNSITSNGEFHHNIRLYYQTRFPTKNIQFFNAGVSGDVTSGILRRIDEDVMKHKPTHVIIMIGMNDVERGWYGQYPTSNTDTLLKRQQAIEKYKINLEKIVNQFLAKNVKLVLQKPSIYDQTGHLKAKNNLGVNDALKICANFIEVLSKKYKIPAIDYWGLMTAKNKELQKTDKTKTIISNDRVHPGAVGHLLMTYQFLKTTKSPSIVSSVVLYKNAKKSKINNATIFNFSRTDSLIKFDLLQNSLPFPIIDEQKLAIELVPFMKDFNLEFFKVKNLKRGNYLLSIDKVAVGTFTALDLKTGVNLAQYPTLQYSQALQVKNEMSKAWKNEENLRAIYWLEFNQLPSYEGDKTDLQKIDSFLKQKFEKVYKTSPYAPFFKSQFEKYIILKPNENQYIYEMNKSFEKATTLSKPVKRYFELRKINL
jgi:lysophospholipase L1-like esterase